MKGKAIPNKSKSEDLSINEWNLFSRIKNKFRIIFFVDLFFTYNHYWLSIKAIFFPKKNTHALAI